MSDTLTSLFGGGASGGILGSTGNFLSSKSGLDLLQAGTTGLSILSKLGQGEASASTYTDKAAQYAMAGQMVGVTAQGQADTAAIGTDATVQQLLQSAFASGVGSRTDAATGAIQAATGGKLTGLQDITQALSKATGFNIAEAQTRARAGEAFTDDAVGQTSLKADLARKLGSIQAAAGASGLDVGAGQAAGARVTQQATDASGIARAQALMRYGAGLASADTLRAASTEATSEGQTQSDLAGQLANISGTRLTTEGDIAADLAQKTADIATPVAQLKGDWAGKLALASGRVAQAQDYASEVAALSAAKQQSSQARAGALMTGLGGLFSILSRGL